MLPSVFSGAASTGDSAAVVTAASARLKSRLLIPIQITPAAGLLRRSLSPRYIRVWMQHSSGLILLCCCALGAQNPSAHAWKFAVSGDSRNCGDIVMPAIAVGV